MNTKNYYGWHELEKHRRYVAEGWRPFAVKYLNTDRSMADKTQKSKRNRLY